jgi:hypothetical protein
LIAERIILRRAVSVPGTGVVTPPIDFDDTESFAAATATLTVTGLTPADGKARVETFFHGGTHATLSRLRMTFDSNTKVYGAIPTGQLDAGELQGVSVGVSGSSYRGVRAYFREADDVSVAVGPELATPTISIAAAYPNLRPRVLLPRQAEYGWSLDARFEHPSHSAILVATSTYLGHPAVWDIEVPDFSGVDGWEQDWGLPPPETVGLEQYRRMIIAQGSPWFDEAADGSIFRVASLLQSPSMALLDAPPPRFRR